MLARLVITFADGTERIISTNDRDWKLFTEGPVRYGSFFQGEVYDATREAAIAGWAKPGYNDAAWKAAVEVSLEGTTLPDSFVDFAGRVITIDYAELKLLPQLGRNVSEWRRENGGTSYRFTVPPNTTATLYLPAAKRARITEGGKKLRKVAGIETGDYANGRRLVRLSSGSYDIFVPGKERGKSGAAAGCREPLSSAIASVPRGEDLGAGWLLAASCLF